MIVKLYLLCKTDAAGIKRYFNFKNKYWQLAEEIDGRHFSTLTAAKWRNTYTKKKRHYINDTFEITRHEITIPYEL